MGENPIRYDNWLNGIHKPALKSGIRQVSKDFPGGIIKNPLPSNHTFFSEAIVEVLGKNILACAPCSVLNAVLSLGIETNTDIKTLMTRLVAADRNKNELLREDASNEDRFYYITDRGIDHAFKLVENPLGKEMLSIQVQQVSDMGIAHQALAHGFTALYVDSVLHHAIAVGGISQNEEKVSWIIIPPDSFAANIIENLGNSILITLICAYKVDPNELTSSVSTPIWIVGRKDNQWKPPENKYEEGEEIIITEND